MEITLGQQCNVGEKDTTLGQQYDVGEKKTQEKQKQRQYSTPSSIVLSGCGRTIYFQLLIPPKRFDIFSPTGGCSEGLGCIQIFL